MATSTSSTATPAEKAAATRRKNAAKRSTTAKKAAATRRQNAASESIKQDIKNPVMRAGVMAEKAVLVPVGAALIARDAIGDLRSNYSTRRKTENELRRYERRGATAKKRIESELRSAFKDIETRTEPVTKNVEFVTARVENAVAGGRNAAAKVQERITALV